MKQILIIRKADGAKPFAITKARKAATLEALRAARVQRPASLDFFLSGAFAESAEIPQAVIDNPIKRERDFAGVGFIVPESDLGRAPKSGERDWQSTCQSVLLWLKKYLSETDAPAVRLSQLSVIVVDDEE